MDVSDPRILDAIEDASTLLYYLTGRQFDGTCTGKVRPCIPCECQGCRDCCCDDGGIKLGYWPITGINYVRINGEDKDPDDFHIAEWTYLAANHPKFRWPNCNNMNSEIGDEFDVECDYVFEIEVEYGIPVPRMLSRAARELACELLGDCQTTAGVCELPDMVSSVSRRGMSMNFTDPMDMLQDGRTGIYAVDLAIATFNPSRLQSPSFVWSPDLDCTTLRRTHTS